MATIEISMTELHRKLALYIELARAGNVVVVVNKLRGRVECHITAPPTNSETHYAPLPRVLVPKCHITAPPTNTAHASLQTLATWPNVGVYYGVDNKLEVIDGGGFVADIDADAEAEADADADADAVNHE